MFILILFDGISCGRVALDRAKIPVTRYYASEIDKFAIQVSQNNYSDIIRLGDVTKWRTWDIDWAKIDIVLAGCPCQAFSFAGKRLGFDDPRGQLFFTFVDILNHIKSLNPSVKYLLENVRMKKEHQEVSTEYMKVDPQMIDSNLVSAQNRKRLYWFNWQAPQSEDKGILLADILLPVFSEDYLCSDGWHHWWEKKQFQLQKKYSQIGNLANKAITLTSRMYANWQGNFIEASQYFISQQQTEKLILNENATRIVGYFGKEHQSSRVYRIFDKSITLSAQGNQT